MTNRGLRTDEGYQWFEPLPRGLRSHAVQEYYDYADLLAVPSEKLPQIRHLLVEG